MMTQEEFLDANALARLASAHSILASTYQFLKHDNEGLILVDKAIEATYTAQTYFSKKTFNEMHSNDLGDSENV